jgi:hypothetical protein
MGNGGTHADRSTRVPSSAHRRSGLVKTRLREPLFNVSLFGVSRSVAFAAVHYLTCLVPASRRPGASGPQRSQVTENRRAALGSCGCVIPSGATAPSSASDEGGIAAILVEGWPFCQADLDSAPARCRGHGRLRRSARHDSCPPFARPPFAFGRPPFGRQPFGHAPFRRWVFRSSGFRAVRNLALFGIWRRSHSPSSLPPRPWRLPNNLGGVEHHPDRRRAGVRRRSQHQRIRPASRALVFGSVQERNADAEIAGLHARVWLPRDDSPGCLCDWNRDRHRGVAIGGVSGRDGGLAGAAAPHQRAEAEPNESRACTHCAGPAGRQGRGPRDA